MSSELVLVDPGEKAEVDVIFVNDLRGDRLDTWSKGKICWPRDLLKKDLESARIITWGYDSKVLEFTKPASQESIFCHAEDLLADLSRLRKHTPDGRPIIFVGHSLGGLLIKETLIRSSEYRHNKQNPRRGQIGEDTKGVVFMGTLHRGSNPAKYAELVANIAKVALSQNPNKQLIEGLKQDLLLLERNRRSFASISRDLPIGSVFEEMEYLTLGRIVEKESASMDTFNETVVTVPANHFEMCQFASQNDVGYKRVADLIEEFASNAVDSKRQGTASRTTMSTYGTSAEEILLIEPAGEEEQFAASRLGQWYGSNPGVEEPVDA